MNNHAGPCTGRPWLGRPRSCVPAAVGVPPPSGFRCFVLSFFGFLHALIPAPVGSEMSFLISSRTEPCASIQGHQSIEGSKLNNHAGPCTGRPWLGRPRSCVPAAVGVPAPVGLQVLPPPKKTNNNNNSFYFQIFWQNLLATPISICCLFVCLLLFVYFSPFSSLRAICFPLFLCARLCHPSPCPVWAGSTARLGAWAFVCCQKKRREVSSTTCF